MGFHALQLTQPLPLPPPLTHTHTQKSSNSLPSSARFRFKNENQVPPVPPPRVRYILCCYGCSPEPPNLLRNRAPAHLKGEEQLMCINWSCTLVVITVPAATCVTTEVCVVSFLLDNFGTYVGSGVCCVFLRHALIHTVVDHRHSIVLQALHRHRI